MEIILQVPGKHSVPFFLGNSGWFLGVKLMDIKEQLVFQVLSQKKNVSPTKTLIIDFDHLQEPPRRRTKQGPVAKTLKSPVRAAVRAVQHFRWR